MAASSQWLFWALLSAVFAALTAIFAKAGLQNITRFRHPGPHGDDPAGAGRLRAGHRQVAAAGLGRGLHLGLAAGFGPRHRRFLGLLFRALQAGDASKVAAVDKGSLVPVALFALFALVFLHERLNSREWLGVGLVSAGIVLMAFKR